MSFLIIACIFMIKNTRCSHNRYLSILKHTVYSYPRNHEYGIFLTERLRKGSEWVEGKIFVSEDDQFFLETRRKQLLKLANITEFSLNL